MEFENVIVIGSHHHNTLGVIRALGRKGIKPFVIMTNLDSHSYILKSHYICEHVQLSTSDDVVPYLNKTFNNLSQKNIIIACHDRIAEILDMYKHTFQDNFIFPGTYKGNLEYYTIKEHMNDLAKEIGFHVPEYINSFSPSLNTAKLPYPVITKPSSSKDGSKKDILIFNNQEDVDKFLEYNKNRTFLIQQFIDKSFEFQLIGCSINSGEEIVIPGVSKLIRTSSGSNTGFLEYTYLTPDFDDTIALTKKFIQATGYSGLFSVEFLRDKNGIDYFMEMNFRNDGNAISVTNAGANLPYYWVQRCLGKKVPIPEIDHTEYVMPEYNEIGLWFSGGINTKQFISDMHRATSFMEYAQDDRKPTRGHLNFYIKLISAGIKRPLYILAKKIKCK